MSEQLTLEEQEHRLAFLLQTSLDFAFGQMAKGKRLIPFATRVAHDGAIDFQRTADEGTELPLAEVYEQIRAGMRAQVVAGGLQAAALVAPIQSDEMELGEGFFQAIRVQLEMPDYCRLIFQPYRVDPGEEGGAGKLVLGGLVATASEHMVFGAEPPEGEDGRTIFTLT
jgi:hypothetical protein